MTFPEKGRTGFEIGAVIAVLVFLATLSFNAGIQYGQIAQLQSGAEAHDGQIRALQAQNSTNGAVLSHIETLVEDMRASQELRATGAGH
jgi:hypothetical protein